MAPADDATFRPLAVDTDDRARDAHAAIRLDLRLVGRETAHTAEAIAAAADVMRRFPEAWPRWRPEPGSPLRPPTNAELAYGVLLDVRAARASQVRAVA